jgi:hypothetical protein
VCRLENKLYDGEAWQHTSGDIGYSPGALSSFATQGENSKELVPSTGSFIPNFLSSFINPYHPLIFSVIAIRSGGRAIQYL